MRFKLPWKLDVCALQRHTISLWHKFLVREVLTAMIWAFYYYSLERYLYQDLGVRWDLPQDLEWTKYLWGQYSLVHHSVRCVAQDLSNLGIFFLPSWIELWIIHHPKPHEIEVRHNQFLYFNPELLIMNKMLRDQYISLTARGVTPWVFQICCLPILHPIH